METKKETNVKDEINKVVEMPIVKVAKYLVAGTAILITAAVIFQVVTYTINSYKDCKIAYNR